MKITLESTATVGELEIDGQAVRGRMWEGATESGIPVSAFIPRISPQTHDPAALAQFEAELQAAAAPRLAPPDDPPASIDRERTEALVTQVMCALQPELAARPPNADNVYVALNALAGAAAVLLTGTGKDPRALAFFDCALVRNLEDIGEWNSQPSSPASSTR